MKNHSFCLKVTVLLLFLKEKNELPLELLEEGKIITKSSSNGYSHLSNKLPLWSQYSLHFYTFNLEIHTHKPDAILETKGKTHSAILGCKEETTTSDIPGGEDLTKETVCAIPGGEEHTQHATRSLKEGTFHYLPTKCYIVYELQLSKYININHSFQGNVLNGLYPYLMTCYSQHLETSNQKTDAILDENGNVKHGQETVSSAIPEKQEQGSITVVPETQESVSSTLRSVVPETQESDTGTELTEVHGMPTQKIVVPETQGAEHVVTEHSDVCAIPAQKIVVPETQGTEVDILTVLTEHCEGRVIPTTEIVVPETQEGDDLSRQEQSDGSAIHKPKIVVPETQGAEVDVLTEHCEGRANPANETDVPEKQEGEAQSGKEQSGGRAIPKLKIVVPETQGAEHVVVHEQSDCRAIPKTQETPDVHQVEETRVHETVLPECVVKVARLPEAQLAKGIEFCFVSRDYNSLRIASE